MSSNDEQIKFWNEQGIKWVEGLEQLDALVQSNNNNSNTSTDSRLELTHGLPALDVGARLRNASDDLGRDKRTLAFYLFDMDERRLHLVSVIRAHATSRRRNSTWRRVAPGS